MRDRAAGRRWTSRKPVVTAALFRGRGEPEARIRRYRTRVGEEREDQRFRRQRYRHGVTARHPHQRWRAPAPASGGVVIVPLTRQLLDLDLTAYCSSPQAIRAHSAGRWPSEDLTREENCRLIEQHEQEHAAGEAYAYAILSADRTREVGCVYLRPFAPFLERTRTCLTTGTLSTARTAIASFWLIDDEAARPSTEQVLGHLRAWWRQWGAADLVVRCLPEEAGSVAALEAAPGLQPLPAGKQELPYQWFAELASLRVT